MRVWLPRLFMSAMILLAILGCHREPLDIPFVNADAAADAALAQYNLNKDRYLDEEELKKAPGIRSALATTDVDRDQKLSRSEMVTRIRRFVGDEVGMMSLSAQFLYNGLPLKGAEVKFIPEPCLGPSFRAGSGTTDAQGVAGMKMDGGELPGMQCGWFKVEVSLKDGSGKELLPPKYNTETELGVEVGLDIPNIERGVQFALKSDTPPK